MPADTWNVEQYDRFKSERSRPFVDLIALVQRRPNLTAIDLGCGTGILTAAFHDQFEAQSTVGIDNSVNMLADAPSRPGLSFVLADAATYEPPTPVDVVISNALIHWIPDHRSLLSRMRGMLKPGGQLAIQFPNNGAHRYQQIAYALQSETPYNAYAPNPIDANLLSLEEYAQTLHELGYENIDVHMRVYLHPLERGDQILEWAKGTFLTHFAKVQPPEVNEQFMTTYRERLFAEIPPDKPYLFTFRRVFLSGVTASRERSDLHS